MNDDFDNILKKKIEQNFRELHVPYEPEHWNDLRAKINTPKNHSKLLPTVVKVAATILIGIALSLYYILESDNEMQISQTEEYSPKIENIPPKTSQNDRQQEQTKPSDMDQLRDIKPQKNNPGKQLKTEKVDKHGESINIITSNLAKAIGLKRYPVLTFQNNAIPPISVFDDSSIVPKVKPIESKASIDNTVIVKRKDMKKKNREFSVLATTNIGFSKAEDGAPVGFSTGISSAFSISRKASITTGFVVAQQNLTVEETGTDISLESNLGEVQEFTRAKLLSLDIPVNFRYQIISSGKTRSFLTVGLSSLFYLQQEFNLTSRQVTEERTESADGSIIITRNISEEQAKFSQPAFSNFDAASLVNFSFGIQHTIFHHSDIIFEPFIKFPLGSLTSRDVRFGYGGIQLQVVL
jgi:hypothetical protein